MAARIEEIEGIGPAFGKKLAAAGVETVDDLLTECCTASGRKGISQKSGLTESQILKWANMADLMRISGIGPQYAELLEGAGVDTVKELRTRNDANLAAKIAEVNAQKKLTGSTPTESMVQTWIEAAKSLEPKITY